MKFYFPLKKKLSLQTIERIEEHEDLRRTGRARLDRTGYQ